MSTDATRALRAAFIILGLSLSAQAAAAPKEGSPSELDRMVARPVDLSPWAYAWRADRPVQEKPEAYFIPRRLERLDTVYRPLGDRIGEKEKKHIQWEPMPPAPKGGLVSALLWLAPVPHVARIELRWPGTGGAIPPPEAVEVRVYPSKLGWFALVRDEPLGKPEVSEDRRTWVYRNLAEPDPKTGAPRPVSAKPSDMVAVFLDPPQASKGAPDVCPGIHAISAGKWKRMDVEIEWGFQPGAEKAVFDGRIEAYVGMTGTVSALGGDTGTTLSGEHQWRSTAAGGARRGIAVSLLVLPRSYRRGGLYCTPWDTRVTLWTKGGNLTFLPDDLQEGPILVPDLGMFVTQAGGGKTARQFAADLAAKNLKTIPQMAREHREAASWNEVMREVKLAHCPPGTEIPPLQPFEEPPETAMRVHLPDERWTDAWRRSSWQLKMGRHNWGTLALEAAQPIRATDLAGLHETSARRLDHWLKAPGGAPDGDFVDGEGGFEYATTMKHGIGWSHDGTHPQTGRILFTMAERYFLTGDAAWFQQHRARMQAAADWIIRQRRLYLKDIPNRQDLEVAGLQPPQVLGDSYLGRSCWRWYLIHDVFSLQGLRRFADALAKFDPPTAKIYHDEADAYGKDILRVVEREMALAPVRPVHDGTYRRCIPASPYARGSMVREIFGTYSLVDIEMGALPLADAFGVLDADDARVGGYLDVLEEALHAGKKDAPKDDDRFWIGFAGLVKYSFVSTLYLRRDDAPCFLRHWTNNYAAFVQPHGGFTEGLSLGNYSGSADKPAGDLGSTGWFVENFRNLLVMEDGDTLWLARATPRAWLEPGKTIAVKNAPTYFGTLAYEIVSDVDHGKINATIEMPARKPPKDVILRLRHPKAAPIKGVTVNGKPWTEYNKEKETMTLKGLTGQVGVTAQY